MLHTVATDQDDSTQDSGRPDEAAPTNADQPEFGREEHSAPTDFFEMNDDYGGDDYPMGDDYTHDALVSCHWAHIRRLC